MIDLKGFNDKFESTRTSCDFEKYDREYNDFWQWKIATEKNGTSHILDGEHLPQTCQKLLNILPGWKTWRGVQCKYQKLFPIALGNISTAYNEIRKYSLLEFATIPEEPLKLIWHELGRVKEEFGCRRDRGDYFVIPICKPLMFLWGQTLPFDSRNRENIKGDSLLRLEIRILGRRWYFCEWKRVLTDFNKKLSANAELLSYCTEKAKEIYKSEYAIPYGRFLDIYYF